MSATDGSPSVSARIRVTGVGRSDHRPFVGGSPVHPVSRLARFTAGELRPVAPLELAEAPRIFVFVHGWTPGSAQVTDLVFAEQGAPAPAWDDRIADMSGIPLVQAYTPLLAALASRDPQAAVLWFSWVDQSATDAEVLAARKSLAATEINGRRLATALTTALGENRSLAENRSAGVSGWFHTLQPADDADAPTDQFEGPRIQLIGHSHGCVVATHAALALPHPPAQLTLLDCPEDWVSRAGGAAGLLADILPRLEPGRSAQQVFVDSYASMFGTPYHPRPGLSDVVDVRLAAPIRIGDDRGAVGYAHEYAVQWYTETVEQEQATCGFGWSVVAPRGDLPPFDPTELGSSYLAVAHNRPIESAGRAQRTPTAHEIVPLDLGEQHLSPAEPDVAIAVHLPEVALVEFDYRIIRPGPRTRLEAAVNRSLVFSCPPGGRPDVPERGRYLRIPPADSQTPTLLQFRLADPGRRTRGAVASLQAVPGAASARNYDSVRTSTAIALLGAAAGATATLAIIGIGLGLRAAARSLRG